MAISSRPPPIAATLAGDPHPHSPAWLTPSRIAASAALSSAAPGQSTRVLSTGGDGGMNRWATVRHRDADQADPEQPVERVVVDDHARERQPDAAADAEHRADDRQAAGHLVARERVAHDPEREREDAAGGALQHAAGDHDLDRGRQRVDRRRRRRRSASRGSARDPCRTGRRACRRSASRSRR